MKEFFNSTWGRWATGILVVVVIFLVAFGLGVSVGYQKAIFSSEWGMNYERNFSGPPPIGMVAQNMHGAAGTVMDVSGSGLAVRDNDNDEQSIIIASDTVIKKMDVTIPLGNVAVGDRVVVIGAPNSSGQVEARFVRVFPAPGPGDGGSRPQL
ncbi:MAG: hypothetical protein WCF77_00035 [Minisyncoccia bacterium]|jgi:hypothetical protein